MNKRLLLVISVLLIPSHQCSSKAQTQTPSTHRAFTGFDVISVKPSGSTPRPPGITTHETTAAAEHANLRLLIANAYGIPPERIAGLPSWAEDEAFDINAKLLDRPDLQKASLSREEKRQLEQEEWQFILKARFHLSTHVEEKLGPVYLLSPSSRGPNVKETSAPPEQKGMFTSSTEIDGKDVSIEDLAHALSQAVGRPVIDKTQLSGRYDVHLKWSVDTIQDDSDGKTADSAGSLYEELKTRLGLKLISAKAPVPVLIVNSVSRPEPN